MTATESFTPPPSPTLSPTFSVSPTPGPSYPVRARVYDRNGLLVQDLGAVNGAGAPSSFALSADPFSPEIALLGVADDQGRAWAWTGAAAGGPAPNGLYVIRLEHAGGSLEKAVTLERKGGSLAELGSLLNPARTELRFSYRVSPVALASLDVFTLAGEKAGDTLALAGTGAYRGGLGGLASGIYLLRLGAQGADGSWDVKVYKLAVVK